MADDGCPLIPDPTRWVDPIWRDNLGELDTFDDLLVETVGQSTQPIASPRSRLLRCRHCGNTEAHSPEDLLLRFARLGRPECCGQVMDYFALLTPAEAVPIHSVAA
jgi:hypothetical protein